MHNFTGEEVRELRLRAGLSVEAAGRLFGYKGRLWERKEFPSSSRVRRPLYPAEYLVLVYIAEGRISGLDARRRTRGAFKEREE